MAEVTKKAPVHFNTKMLLSLRLVIIQLDHFTHASAAFGSLALFKWVFR